MMEDIPSTLERDRYDRRHCHNGEPGMLQILPASARATGRRSDYEPGSTRGMNLSKSSAVDWRDFANAYCVLMFRYPMDS